MSQEAAAPASELPDFLRSIWQEIAKALGTLGDRPVEIVPGKEEILDEGALRKALPDSAAAIGPAGTAAGPILFLLPNGAARRLARLIAKSPDADAESSDTEALAEPEVLALKGAQEPLAGLLTQSLAARSIAVEGSRLALLSGSVWNGDDPLGEGRALLARAEMKLGEVAGLEVLMILPAGLAEPGAEAPAAAPPGEVKGPSFAGLNLSAELAERVRAEMAGVTLSDCSDLGELFRIFPQAETAGAVVDVPAGEEYILSSLRALRELPGCAQKPLIIVLEEPSAENVIHCAQLRLFGVLSPAFGHEEFERRRKDATGD